MKSLIILITMIAAIAVCLLACRKNAPPAPSHRVEASALPKIVVNTKLKLLYTFAKEDDTFESVSEIDKVPDASKGWVRVVDLSMPPDKRLDRELVYVSDLRAKGKDGNYPYVVMSRSAFEIAALNRSKQGAASAASQPSKPLKSPAPSTTQPSGKPAIILFSTSWCGACRTAREYFTAKNIPFVEKDIEKDPSAADELMQKAKAAGISASGVPVIEINGTLMQGFDPQSIESLLSR